MPIICSMKSTYGNRSHGDDDPEDVLADIIARTIQRGGTVIVPAFAVGRAQILLFHVARLKKPPGGCRLPCRSISTAPWRSAPRTSSSATPPTRSFHPNSFRTSARIVRYVRTAEESKSLTANPIPKVIISASGMATGGRVLHHLEHYAPDPKNAILFTGFQAGGTRGASMVAGAEKVKMYGAYVPVRAEVHDLSMLSAHADKDELLRWAQGFKMPPAYHLRHSWRASRRRCIAAHSGGNAFLELCCARPCPADGTGMIHSSHALRARRFGIDTHAETVVFLHKDCPVSRSEGFTSHNRILLSAGDRQVIATLYQVESDILGCDEAGLSDATWQRLARRRR